MERKSPIHGVPMVGVASHPGVIRRVAVVEADPAVRGAMERMLPAKSFSVRAFADAETAWPWLRENRIELALVDRELPRHSGTRLAEAMRKLPWGGTIGIVLVGSAYNDPYLGAGECAASGADAYLPLPATPGLVEQRLSTALARREPLERLGALPVEKARLIDSLFERFERMTYYELFEVDTEADEDTLRQAFHRLSLLLHPDRYARLRAEWPHAYDRINTIYKRFNEAWRVLMDPGQRARYNLGLQQRGAIRLAKSRQSRREEKEQAMCRTDAAREKVAQSLDMRSVGDLEGAEEPLIEACALEPENTELAQVLAAVRKLLDIMRRG